MFNWIKKFLKKEEVLWQETDKLYPQYSVKVIRVRPYVGKLTVYYNGKALAHTGVEIFNDAKFGVDFFNLEIWAMTAASISDAHQASLESK